MVASATALAQSVDEANRAWAIVAPAAGGLQLAPAPTLGTPLAPPSPSANKSPARPQAPESTVRANPRSLLVAEVKTAPRASVKSAQASAEALAVLTLAIAPWGEVYVDGNSKGVSPPLQELEIEPGRHRIEIRNAGSASHVVVVNAKPGERLRIKHKF